MGKHKNRKALKKQQALVAKQESETKSNNLGVSKKSKDKNFKSKSGDRPKPSKKFSDKTPEAASGDDTLTLDIVKELGGTEDDLKLVNNIKDGSDGNDLDSGVQSELKQLISSLNFSKFSADSLTIKDSEVTADNDEDDDEEEEKDVRNEPSVSTQAPSSKGKTSEKIQDNEISSSSDSVTNKAENDSDGDSDDDSKATENVKSNQDFSFIKDKNLTRTHCVVKAGEVWYEAIADVESDGDDSCNSYWLSKIEKYTQATWDKDVENYKKLSQKGSKKSEAAWIQTVLKSGTLNDKFSAYVLLLQDSPVHNISVLETLIEFVNLKSRRPCLMAIENLQKLFLEVLLVTNRKLRNFDKNPFSKLTELSGGNKDTIDKYLISWMFEDKLKKTYLKFLDNLELVSKDTIDKTKIKSLSTLLELLAGNPEQESLLLSRIVNKLGDPSRGIAAKAMFLLTQLLERHPVMKWVVVGEVERLLYRPNIAARAQYFGICFLSQILLEKYNQDK